jgi:hypothetical protein
MEQQNKGVEELSVATQKLSLKQGGGLTKYRKVTVRLRRWKLSNSLTFLLDIRQVIWNFKENDNQDVRLKRQNSIG